MNYGLVYSLEVAIKTERLVPDGIGMEEVVELKKEVEDLRRLVHTLLTVIMEESDGSDQALRPTGVEESLAATRCDQ